MKRMDLLALFAIVSLGVAGCGREGEDNEQEIEADAPAVGATPLDSAAAGADVMTTAPLTDTTTSAGGDTAHTAH